MTPLTVYATPHKNSSKVGPHFARGAKLPYREVPCELQPGGMVSYGAAHGLRPLLARCQAEGREWVYLDNGYFKPGHWGGYFRVTRNAYQHDGTGQATPARFLQLGLRIAPWRPSGSFILVCPPTNPINPERGLDVTGWLPATLETLRRHTDRQIRVRTKDQRRSVPLGHALKGCHAVVTWVSNAATEALIHGYPVFATAPCAAYRMGEPDLSKIETPRFPPDRERWAWNLANAQFTLAEMDSGLAWRTIMEEDHARAVAA